MTTTTSRTPSYAPHDNRMFAPLRLGPVTKARVMDDSLAPPPQYLPLIRTAIPPTTAADVKYPRIIVRDSLGRTLDTFTALQEAIYRASWTRKKLGEWPKTPLEWRLPKAPTPSKPDYSRAGPGVMASYQYDAQSQRRHLATSRSYDVSSNARRVDFTADVLVNLPTLEIPVDDVAFVAESLNHLPNLPSFSFLRHSILAGEAAYVQIVASILLHQRQLRAKDQRDALWTFPGFCSGCKRAGFCYGCSKNQKPHVHEDVPAMTGGGFRFWKRDRPCDPQSWKNPSNWKVPSTDEELRAVIEKYGDLSAYERARIRASRRAEDDVIQEETSHDLGERYQRLRNLGTYPPYVTIVSTDDFVHETQLEDVADAGVQRHKEMVEGEEGLRRRRAREEMMRKRKMGVAKYEEEVMQEREITLASEVSSDRMLVRFDTGYDDELTEGRTRDGQGADDEEDEGVVTERSRSRHKSRVAIIKSSRDRSESSHSQGQRSPIRTTKTSRLGFVDKLKEEEAEELARILRERAKENVPFGKKRRDVNYTAPKFFTVQKNSRKITVAKDPFSSDRDLDLPKGPTFQLKKSEKKTTKFIEFKKGDRGWKAPKKFEVKLEEKKATKFWSRSPSRSDSKGRRGRRGEDIDDDELRRGRRKDVSSDSGIGSGTAGDKETNDESSTDLDRNDILTKHKKTKSWCENH